MHPSSPNRSIEASNVCVCVSVCVRDRDRDSARDSASDRAIDRITLTWQTGNCLDSSNKRGLTRYESAERDWNKCCEYVRLSHLVLRRTGGVMVQLRLFSRTHFTQCCSRGRHRGPPAGPHRARHRGGGLGAFWRASLCNECKEKTTNGKLESIFCALSPTENLRLAAINSQGSLRSHPPW